ncbi:MAG: hypothetical protein HYU57_05780 [Micavibrio aeruginosavorus]|nr:hypothetical protein [Micavibrio aeruginosavorus]
MNDREGGGLTPVFNQLSLGDRLTLYGAVTAKSITRIAREDVQKNRIAYPFYALPISFILAPIPVPGSNLVPLTGLALCMGGWIALGLTQTARRNRDELKRDFAAANIIAEHKAMIIPHPHRPGGFDVRNIAVTAHTLKVMGKDSWEATRYFFRPLKRWL